MSCGEVFADALCRAPTDEGDTTIYARTEGTRKVHAQAPGAINRRSVLQNAVLEYDTHVAMEWADSAEKHYPIADGIHAIKNRKLHLRAFDVDPDTDEIVDLIVGPARDGQILEVFVHRRAPQIVYIFHVLHFRPKTKARAQAIITARQNKEGKK